MKGYIWMPECHELLGQSCVVYFLRLKVPFGLTVAQIEPICKEACLPGYRIYPLLGSEDFVVIARGQAHAQTWFHELAESHPSIGSVRQFEFKQKFPAIERGEPVPIDLPLLENYLRLTADERLSRTQDFIKQKLLVPLPVPKKGGYRFFTHFQLPKWNSQTEPKKKLAVDSSHIIDTFRYFARNGFHVTVYFLESAPREFIAEILSDNYYAYFTELGKHAKLWAKEVITTITYAVSSTNMIEADPDSPPAPGLHEGDPVPSPNVIEVDDIEIQPDLQRDDWELLRFLQRREAFAAYVRSTSADRRMLLSFFEKHRGGTPDGSNPFESTLRELLLSYLLKDRECLIRALTIVVKIEGYFSLVVRHVWKEIYGENRWIPTVYQAIEELGLGDNSPKHLDRINLLTLSQTLDVANKLDESKNYLKKEFGPDWHKIVHSVRDERNDFAHGRTVTDDDAFKLEKWTKSATAICEIRKVYEKVVSFYSRRVKPPTASDEIPQESHG